MLHKWFILFSISTGDLENRAVIREPATLLITNATRSDTAKYRCEVTAADDQKSFDEIVIDLVVRGMLVYLYSQLIDNTLVCFRSTISVHYYVHKGKPCLLIHMLNAVRWHCVVSGLWHTDHDVSMTRPTQLRRRVLGYKRKPLKLHMLWIAVLKKASPAYFGGTVPVMQRQKQP